MTDFLRRTIVRSKQQGYPIHSRSLGPRLWPKGCDSPNGLYFDLQIDHCRYWATHWPSFGPL